MMLAFDTSGPSCAVAVVQGETRVAAMTEDMARGQAERLMPMLEECLAKAGLAWRDLDALAVGTGPGNFTGTRIAVSAARGLALGLGIPAVGVSMFEAMALDHSSGAALVILPAPRERAYLQVLNGDEPAGEPRLIDPAQPPADLALGPARRVIGHRAGEIARFFGIEATDPGPGPLPDLAHRIARVASRRLLAGRGIDRPAPLYVRPADAAPPSDPPPVLLDP